MSERAKCPECGRDVATDADWVASDIDEGDRDDLCRGSGANCELPYPDPSRAEAKP